MSGSSRSRQKRKLEPISIEELAGTTGMSGFCSFLTRDAAVAVPALDGVDGPVTNADSDISTETSAPAVSAPTVHAGESGAPKRSAGASPALVIAAPDPPAVDMGALDVSAPITSTPHAGSTPESAALLPSAPDSTALQPGVGQLRSSSPTPAVRESSPPIHSSPPSPIETAPDFAAPEPDAVESGAPDFVWRRRIRVREAVTVQDGHSLAEQAVYDAMYRAGKPYQADSRILTIGLRTLAELSRMAYSNCKANVRSLVAKLAIDERDGFSYTDGRTYIIYSFRDILRRRKAAGLTHVVRTRGVAFVDPNTGNDLSQSSAPVSPAAHSTAPEPPAPVFSPGAPVPTKTSAPKNGESSAPEPGPHIRNKHLLRNTGQESSSAVSLIIAALRRYIPDVDDDAAAEIWQRCLENAPDARLDEILHFIELKAGTPRYPATPGIPPHGRSQVFQGRFLPPVSC